MIDMWLLLVVRFIHSEYLLNYVFSFWFGYACFAYRCFKRVRDKWIIKIDCFIDCFIVIVIVIVIVFVIVIVIVILIIIIVIIIIIITI